MKVIILKDVGGVGKRNEVKEIADGYALNYLIPQGLAVQATPEKVSTLRKRLEEEARSSAERNAELASRIKAVDGRKIIIRVKANERGHLFKSVSKKDLVEHLADATTFIVPEMISGVPAAVKEVGEYAAHIAGAGTEATVNFVVEAAAN